jgi:hypothetical protein
MEFVHRVVQMRESLQESYPFPLKNPHPFPAGSR